MVKTVASICSATRCLVKIRWRNSDRKSTRLNSSHTEIYTLSLHDALPICRTQAEVLNGLFPNGQNGGVDMFGNPMLGQNPMAQFRSEEHTSELQSHRDLHSFPTRRSSDLPYASRSFERSFPQWSKRWRRYVRQPDAWSKSDGAI